MYMEDYAVVEEGGRGLSVFGAGEGEGGKSVFILLPYFQRGNLQDAVNANLINHMRFPLRELVGLFVGVCRGLERIHNLDREREGGGYAHRDIKPGEFGFSVAGFQAG